MAVNNSDEFRFSDFTLTNYRRLLRLALKNYRFVTFTNELYSEQIIILRHDIEFSVPIALQMAEIESNLGIKATYFLQNHSEFYNPIDNVNSRSIKKIIENGHDIGLHFDSHYWGIKTEKEIEKYIEIDKRMIETYFDVKIKSFSFHNTNGFILACDKPDYAGLINVYSKKYKTEAGYCSDSTGYWRYERLEDRLKEAKDKVLQILIHDGMWQEEVLPPRKRVFKVIDDNASALKKYYDNTLKELKAKNVDWKKIL